MNLNSHGTDRVSYLKELRQKKMLWGKNPTLVENFEKLKTTCEFKKEYPRFAVTKPGHTKYGAENYNYHLRECRGGYNRHGLGYKWAYS
jgi:hypothetical protein